MKNGFTLVELLATIVIIGLIAIIMIPGFSNISGTLKETNRDNKIVMIRHAALNFAENKKDEIKNSADGCVSYKIEELIKEGYLSVEKEIITNGVARPIVIDPVTNKELIGNVYVCYCNKKYSLISYFEGQKKNDFC